MADAEPFLVGDLGGPLAGWELWVARGEFCLLPVLRDSESREEKDRTALVRAATECPAGAGGVELLKRFTE